MITNDAEPGRLIPGRKDGNEWVDGWIILTDVWMMGEWVIG